MSFNTFCGQDPTNAATYNRVLLRFQEGGGGGGVPAVNAGANIDIVNPLLPVVALQSPLTANLDLGAVDVVDSGGFIGAAGTVLSSNGVGAGTSWIAGVPAGNVNVINDNTNVNRFLTFVAATGGPQQIYADSAVGVVSVNPSTGDFNVVDTVIIQQSQLAIGKGAGALAQNLGAVAIGFGAANNNQGIGGVAIGSNASTGAFQGASAVAIGVSAAGDPLTSQGNGAVAIGSQSGFSTQGDAAVAIGEDAGNITQGLSAVAIGDAAGNNNQAASAVAIGTNAGLTNQGIESVAIGKDCGMTQQGIECVAVGNDAGMTNQENFCVAIGTGAGNTTQRSNAIAIGNGSGSQNQGLSAVAIGVSSGNANQGVNSIAIGNQAGLTAQGANAIAIGENAADTNQTANSICINASGAAVQAPTASLYITPIINSGPIANPVPLATNFLLYNTATAEITYGDGAGIGGGGGSSFPVADISYYNEQVLPATTVPFSDGSVATGDAIAGGFNPTVSLMYDPAAQAAIPNVVPDTIIVELNYSASQEKPNFLPVIPNSQTVNDITSAPLPPLSVLYNFCYSVNGGATLQFPTVCVASSIYHELPVALSTIQGTANQTFNTSLTMRAAMSLATLLPADFINFKLFIYTQYAGQFVDNTGASGGLFEGSVSIKTSMIRT